MDWTDFVRGYPGSVVVAQERDILVLDHPEAHSLPWLGTRRATIVDSTPEVERVLLGTKPDSIFAHFARSIEALTVVPTIGVNILGDEPLPVNDVYRAAARTRHLALQRPLIGKDRFSPEALPNLEGLSIDAQYLVPGFRSPSLREFGLTRCRGQDLGFVAGFPKLEELFVWDSRSPITLALPAAPPPLRSLSLAHLTRLDSLDGIGALAATLEELTIEACRRVSDLNPLRTLTRLRQLEIGGCGDIASLAPLSGLPDVEQVWIWGASMVVDGDLTPLVGLPRLSSLSMQNRRHYKPTVKEVCRARGINMPEPIDLSGF